MPEPLSSDHSRSEPRPTEARLLNMVFPDNTNHLGTLFGLIVLIVGLVLHFDPEARRTPPGAGPEVDR